MQKLSPQQSVKLKKKILYNRQIAKAALFMRKKKLEQRIDFKKLCDEAYKVINDPDCNYSTAKLFCNEIITLSNFFVEYNKAVKKVGEIEYQEYHSVSFYDVKYFEYAETMIIQKGLKKFSHRVNSDLYTSHAYAKMESLVDSCRYKNIKQNQNEKTM